MPPPTPLPFPSPFPFPFPTATSLLHLRPLTSTTTMTTRAHSTHTHHENPSQQQQRQRQAELYHHQTKHHLTRYSRGPRGLDWSNQPNPFLRYHPPSPIVRLSFPTTARDPSPHFPLLFTSPSSSLPPPSPISHSSLSLLLFHSLSLSAWKSTPYSTWSLRVNPSSGNLHPTESYLLSPPLQLDDDPSSPVASSPFLAHYAPKEHALELRCSLPTSSFRHICPKDGSFLVGLSSIFWREAWKYGERAFRYCNHDVGHAIAAVAVAAASLGWDARLLDGLGHEELRNLLGIGRGFPVPERDVPQGPTRGRMPWVELEHPDCAVLVFPAGEEGLEEAADYSIMAMEIAKLSSLRWSGAPNSLSKEHVCWDVIYRTAEAVEKTLEAGERFSVNPLRGSELLSDDVYAASTVWEVVRRRRSAVDMDGVHVMGRQTFYQIMLRCLPSGAGERQARQLAVPFRVLPWDSEVHCAVFVHMVAELPMGLYFLVRNEDHFDELKRAMRPEFEWTKPEGCPAGLPLYRLVSGDCRELAKKLSCHQDIASDGCFSLGMVAHFEPALRERNAWMYPRLFWETGVLGQVLYLEAHAVGISATGIGCFFDDAVHEVLGLKGSEFQSLYHFTVGSPILDRRIMSLPAYPGPNVDA